MKRLLFIALGIICYHVVTFAQEVKVECAGVCSANRRYDGHGTTGFGIEAGICDVLLLKIQ